MGDASWLRTQVEHALAEVWGPEHVRPDCDGDYGFRSDTAMGWVRLAEDPRADVTVVAVAAHDVRPLKAVLREVNEINMAAGRAKVGLDGGWVTVETTVEPDRVDAETLDAACHHVMSIASRVGPLFATVHGGRTPFEGEQQAG
ncbi:MAG TPA: YbjN domain-containing protein [Segeticoccus sp.]|nr:YbjN domain-containing protein [Segeticoccus sp.]